MLHPNQFQVNEAWIAFQLNEAPIQVQAKGQFKAFVLMDAASCYIMGTELVPVGKEHASGQRLLKAGVSQAPQLPTRLFVSTDEAARLVGDEAARLGIAVERVDEDQLSTFTGEARSGFRKAMPG